MAANYYDIHAKTFFDKTVELNMEDLYKPFLSRVSQSGRILDAGCGSGRDVKEFLKRGYTVSAFDGSRTLACLATEYSGIDVEVRTFDEIEEKSCYDGIWTCASLLHVPRSELGNNMFRLWRALKPGGTWFVSFKYGDSDRYVDGRYFCDMNEELLTSIVESVANLGVDIMWSSTDIRKGEKGQWINALLQRTI